MLQSVIVASTAVAPPFVPTRADAAMCARILNGTTPSPAQHAQDTFAFHNLFSTTGRRGFYVDSGANEPFVGSNTWIFDRCLGWQGLCVEPNPKYHANLATKRSCTVVPDCLGARDGELTKMSRRGPMSRVGDRHHAINVTCNTLQTTLMQHASRASVDLWSLDVEGLEMRVLKSWTNAVSVGAILVEDNKLDSRTLDDVMQRRGYRVFARWLADTLYVPTERPQPANFWCPPPEARRSEGLTRMMTPKARVAERETQLACPHRQARSRNRPPDSTRDAFDGLPHGLEHHQEPSRAIKSHQKPPPSASGTLLVATERAHAAATEPVLDRPRRSSTPSVLSPATPPRTAPTATLGGDARLLLPWHAELAINAALNVTILNGSSSFHIIGLRPRGMEGQPCPEPCSTKARGGPCAECGEGSLCCRSGMPSDGDVCDAPTRRFHARLQHLEASRRIPIGRPKGWVCINPLRTDVKLPAAGSASTTTYLARVFNPFVSDDDGSVAVNVHAVHLPGHSHTASVWLSPTGAVRHIRYAAEDARLVSVSGALYSIFTRYRAHQAKDVWIGMMRAPFTERKLDYVHHAHSEGNWLPFVYNDTLYVLYSVCPHLVLRIEIHSGKANEVSRAASPLCNGFKGLVPDHSETHRKHQHSGRSGVLRGSAMGGHDSMHTRVGVAHTKRVGIGGVSYTHYFIRQSATPPHRLLGISRGFRFPRFLALAPGPTIRPRIDDVQYCLSLRMETNGDLAMEYSSGDAAAVSLHVPRDEYCNFTEWC